jgi:hypothetical protein
MTGKVDAKFERLITQCKIPDQESLKSLLSTLCRILAESGNGQVKSQRTPQSGSEFHNATPDSREADTLNELSGPLNQVIKLLSNPLNGNRLAQHWRALPDAERSFLPNYLPDFIRQLDLVQETAAQAHRNREQRRGPLPARGLAESVKLLVDYWERDLERKFTRDAKWVDHEPITKAEWFVWLAIDYFGPWNWKELRTALRTFAENRER